MMKRDPGCCAYWVLGGAAGVNSYGAPVPDEPRNNLRPSGNVRSLPLARFVPSFDWYPSTTISVPGIKESLVNPRRNRTFGVPASIAQFTTVPSGFFTETCSQVWGLTHSIFEIVPLKFTGLFASNSEANAWCADTEVDHPVTARPVIQTAMASFVRIGCLPAAHRIKMGALPRRFNYPELGYWRPSVLPTVPLIEAIAGRYLAGDIDRHGIAFPALDQRLLAKISVHEFFDEFVAAKLEKLHVRFHATIERHGDLPRPREDLGVFDRHFVPNDVR